MQEEFDNILDDMEDTYDVISITSENGEIIDCFIIDGVIDNNTQYLLVVACDDFEKDEAEAFILKQMEKMVKRLSICLLKTIMNIIKF